MSAIIYKGEEWHTKPIRDASSAEKQMMIKHRNRTECEGTVLIQLKNAGLIFDKYLCETCHAEL